TGGQDAALAVAERVHRAVEAQPWERIGPGLRVTLSIGVGSTGSTPGEPWAVADAALSTAKRTGRNRIVVGP
ncbi:MAG TPA: hypothetical protein VN257_02795, partial [Actinotalea sp.]|nr:hypothetical protein [Actinotalea sp.]